METLKQKHSLLQKHFRQYERGAVRNRTYQWKVLPTSHKSLADLILHRHYRRQRLSNLHR